MSDDYVKRIERFLDRHGIDDYAAYANRSLSHTEPVSGTSKRKLKNGEQRPAPKTRQLGTASVNFPGQRLWRACLSLRAREGELVSGRHRTGLGPSEMEIGKAPAETRRRIRWNAPSFRDETGLRWRNPPECRHFSSKLQARDSGTPA